MYHIYAISYSPHFLFLLGFPLALALYNFTFLNGSIHELQQDFKDIPIVSHSTVLPVGMLANWCIE